MYKKDKQQKLLTEMDDICSSKVYTFFFLLLDIASKLHKAIFSLVSDVCNAGDAFAVARNSYIYTNTQEMRLLSITYKFNIEHRFNR